MLKFNTMTIDDLDNRMFQLFEELKNRGVLKYKRAFCAACDIPEQNMYNIEKKRNHFTLMHVANICKFYNLDANWIIHKTDDLFMRKNSIQTAHKTPQKSEL